MRTIIRIRQNLQEGSPLNLKTEALILTILSILLLSPLTLASSPKVQTQLPSNSVAVSDDSLATFFNPAGLGIGRSFNLYYLKTYHSDPGSDDAFFVSGRGTGFSMAFANAENDIDFTRYTLSTGNRLGTSLYWGTGYSWINSDDKSYDKFSSWSFGLMLRRQYLAVGAIVRDLNRPRLHTERLGRTYDFGLAIRPSTSRITFSIDARKVEQVAGLDFNYGIELRPINGITLRGSLNNDHSFDLRFGINYGQVGSGTYNRFNTEGDHQDGVGYLYLSSKLHTKPRNRRHIFLDVRMREIENTLKIAQRDPDVAGVLIQLGGSDYRIGRLQELSDIITNFRATGKKVICYMHTCSTGNYILASVCDQIVLHPSGEIRLIGLRSEVSFYKGALDKLGIRADLEHIGAYKSASDVFTRTNMSEAHREVQNSILDDLYDQLTQSIATGRGLTQDEVKQLINQGPFTAKQALGKQLVHRLAYRDQLKAIATELTGREHALVKANAYLNTEMYVYDWETPLPKIAIIEADGMMVTGESFTDPFTGTKTMGSTTIARAIESVREDNSIKAVVLRINSGGGFVLASDIIWRELIRLKEVKPLIVSMGDAAASGGYYIAAPADVIVASPGTITGSIGVISGKYSFKTLYDKIGIHKEIIKRGERADFYTDYGDYPPEERAIIKEQITEIYDDFLAKVAEGRGMTTTEVDRIGRGRVWTGRQAKENGLVDQLGGLDLALSIARKKVGLENREVALIWLPKRGWLSQWFGDFRVVKTIASGTGWHPPTSLVEQIRKHRTFLVMPYDVRVHD